MENNKNFIEMMQGNIGEFTLYELWAILTNQNQLGINTIAIQKGNNNKYYCFVDKATLDLYEKREV